MKKEDLDKMSPDEIEAMFDADPWFYIVGAAVNVGAAILIMGCMVGLIALFWDWLG